MIRLKQLIKENLTSPLTAYHGSNRLFKRFSLDTAAQPIIWFTSEKNRVIKGETGAEGRKYIYTIRVSIKKAAGWDEYNKLGLWELQRGNYDGAILPDDDYFDGFVFSPNQIKILNVEKYD